MNEKKYEKRLDFQQKIISRQSEQIESLKLQNEKLKLELQKKDELINSVSSLREELIQNVSDSKKYKEEYGKLINEVRRMKKIMDKEVFNGRWWIIKLLLK
jgi:hypothetical protein